MQREHHRSPEPFPHPELCCLGGRRYYGPVRLPLRCPGLRLWPYTGACFRGYRPTHGRSRVSPVAWTTFAACRPLYAGAVPGCSRIHGPDCCLHLHCPGSARSAPHGFGFRRGRVQLPYGLQLCSTSLRLRLSTVTGDLTTGLLWRLARAGLSPAGRQPFLGGTQRHRIPARQTWKLTFRRSGARFEANYERGAKRVRRSSRAVVGIRSEASVKAMSRSRRASASSSRSSSSLASSHC